MRRSVRLLGAAAAVDGLYMLSTGFHTSGYGDSFNSLPLLPWPGRLPAWMHASVVVWIVVGGGLVMLGFSRRIVPATVGASYLYITLSDWGAFHQHFVFGGQLFVLVAWYGSRSYHHRRSAHLAVLGLVTVVYVSAGLHKLEPAFRSGQLIESRLDRRGLDWVIPATSVLVWTTIVIELGLPLLLWIRPRFGTLVGISFHLGIVFFSGAGLPFGALMIATYPAFWNRPLLRTDERLSGIVLAQNRRSSRLKSATHRTGAHDGSGGG